VLDRGQGALLYDGDGKEYLDALSGGVFAVLAGYGREEIAQAMYEQAVRLAYTSPYGTVSEVTVELARVSLTLGDLSGLEPGGSLPLHAPRDGRVVLRLGDRAVARGQLVEIDGALGVRLDALEALP